jgi:hypothetical protein
MAHYVVVFRGDQMRAALFDAARWDDYRSYAPLQRHRHFRGRHFLNK